jgi:multidrug efflux pump subunit AcrA (membrane-fusion protein)
MQDFSRVKKPFSLLFSKSKAIIDRFPLFTFFGFLAILLLIVVVSNSLRTPPPVVTDSPAPVKDVTTYQLGEQPRVQIQAKVEKSGTITLVAQTAGVVQQIKRKAGEKVNRGTAVVILSTTYQGGNAPAVGRQIAQKNYQFLVDNYDAQKAIIDQQKDIAQKGNTQASDLRSINRQSLDETKSLIDLDTEIIAGLDKQIAKLTAESIDGSNDAAIIQAKSLKAQAQGGLNSLRAGLRAAEYSSADDKTGAQLSAAQRDLTLKTLDLQQKTLDLNRDISKLNVRLSQISEALMYPASPCAGVVERVFVKVGQAVTPGTVIASIRGNKDEASLVALVSQHMAQNISIVEPSTLMIENQKISLQPTYISKEPTEGTLHSVIYNVPSEYANALSNGSSVTVEMPMGADYASTERSYIPLDAVYQTQDHSYVYTVDKNQEGSPSAKTRRVKLGTVYGQFVEVIEGITTEDYVILNRNVLEGDVVHVTE